MENQAIRNSEVHGKLYQLFPESNKNDSWVIAMDEVGRGSLFGPVTVGGILLKASELFSSELSGWQSRVRDSKKLKPALRNELADHIKSCYVYHTSHVSVRYINTHNINRAIQYAVYRTARTIMAKASLIDNSLEFSYILLDGNYNFKFPQIRMTKPIPAIHSIVKGDNCVFHISCASIVAKEERDRLLKSCASKYEPFALERNAGYGTLHHRKALVKHGATRLHRREFIKKIVSM